MYLRFTRDAVPMIYDEHEEFVIGKAKKLRSGKDIAIIANGDTVYLALEAVKKLEEQGIEASLLDMHTIKPLDREAVVECLDIGRMITVEDHNILNGLGSAVCEVAKRRRSRKSQTDRSARPFWRICTLRKTFRNKWNNNRKHHKYSKRHAEQSHLKVGYLQCLH